MVENWVKEYSHVESLVNIQSKGILDPIIRVCHPGVFRHFFSYLAKPTEALGDASSVLEFQVVSKMSLVSLSFSQ